jgi:hypothetical protein
MQSVLLSDEHQNAFANAALLLRYDPEENVPIAAHKLNTARRSGDRGADLWHTFNRVQENIIQGGLRGVNRNGGRMSTRQVTGVSENVRLNRALWSLGVEMGLINQKNGLFHDTPGALGISGLQPEYRFQIRQ